MASVVIPFRGLHCTSRFEPLAREVREALVEAMLADVVETASTVGPTFVVAPEGTDAGAATLVIEPGGGLGAAVRAGLEAAVAGGGTAPYLIVNADLPAVTARDLFTLAGAVPEAGLALAPAADGSTNALALSAPDLFVPVYGPGSAERFAGLAPSRLVEAPNLMDDVDSVADLLRLRDRLGRRTARVLRALPAEAAA